MLWVWLAWREPVKVALDVSRLTCLYAESPAERSPQCAETHTQHGQMKQQCRAFLSTRGLRADDEGDSLKVYDLVRGLEVVELTSHPDHVMCGSMS